jgi:hypothetical protein
LVETIWKGDVKEFSRAYDLICIVDQIHNYAVNDHREFVMKHLEAWHVRHEKTRQPSRSSASAQTRRASDGTEAEDGKRSREVEDYLDCLMDLDTRMPEWLLLKEKSKSARQAKAQETRERNRRLRRSIPSLDTVDD